MKPRTNPEDVQVGCYHVLTLVLLSVNFVTVAMSHIVSVIYKYTPKFYCQEAGVIESLGAIHLGNRTYGCPSSECPGGRYVFEADSSSRHDWSVAMEWRLVCEREPLMKAATSVYFGGMLAGGVLAGYLADRLGRLPVLAVCLYAQGIMGVGLNVVMKYEYFLVLRGLQGFFIQGLESCSFILCMELFPAKFRTLVALIVLSMRSCGYALLSGLSYVVPDWRILQLVISVPTAVTVLYIWILPESPKWLMSKGKRIEAKLLLERITKYNNLWSREEKKKDKDVTQKPTRKTRHDQPEETDNLLNVSRGPKPESSASAATICMDESTAEKKQPGSTSEDKDEVDNSYHLVARKALGKTDLGNKKKKIRFKCSCLILICLWFTSSTAFHALVSQPQRLTSKRHLSLVLASLVELASFILTYALVNSRCGRRWILCGAQLLIGISCIAIGVLSLANPGVSVWIDRVKTGIFVMARMANVSTFFILRLLIIEFFPPASRGTGIGLCIAAEIIGGLVTPYISLFNNYVLELPRFLIGTFGICAALVTLIFPETSYDILQPESAECSSFKNNAMMRDIERLNNSDWVDAGNGIIVNFTENKTGSND